MIFPAAFSTSESVVSSPASSSVGSSLASLRSSAVTLLTKSSGTRTISEVSLQFWYSADAKQRTPHFTAKSFAKKGASGTTPDSDRTNASGALASLNAGASKSLNFVTHVSCATISAAVIGGNSSSSSGTACVSPVNGASPCAVSSPASFEFSSSTRTTLCRATFTTARTGSPAKASAARRATWLSAVTSWPSHPVKKSSASKYVLAHSAGAARCF
mmetsp:Transcript_2388/g.8242  ORF Transcript_2388/g.8242 Transcript_2388/m.8242 type:complete len:216 (-) Transcript_2388:763-1410(-)